MQTVAVGADRKRKPYWRNWTPLVTLWGMITQRLGGEQSAEDVVTAFRNGAADDLDSTDGHAKLLSERIKSEQNSAYVQARERLSIEMVRVGRQQVQATVEAAQTGAERWHGHAVRLIDGTTYRLPPNGDLVETYGQPTNQHGAGYWVTVKSVASFCLFSHTIVAHSEGRCTTSETALVQTVMAADTEKESIYVGDRGYGQYRMAQVAQAYHHYVIIRLDTRRITKLLKTAGRAEPLASGEECVVTWQADDGIQVQPDLPAPGITGRLLHQRVNSPGFRPYDLYLFTTLLAVEKYSFRAVVELYGQRWDVELHYRDIKSTLMMDQFNVKSASLFRKELEVGLLTYNLICAVMVQAARKAGIVPRQLSFTRCLRRIRDMLLLGVPEWVSARFDQPFDWLIERLTQCRLPNRHRKADHEPRATRRRPAVFPALKGSRADARAKLIADVSKGVAAIS